MSTFRHVRTRGDPRDPARPIRTAWLTTALSAALVAGLLLYAAHGMITSLLGIAGLTSVVTALTAAIYAFRRSRQIHASLDAGHRLPTALHALHLIAILTTATALLTLTALLANR